MNLESILNKSLDTYQKLVSANMKLEAYKKIGSGSKTVIETIQMSVDKAKAEHQSAVDEILPLIFLLDDTELITIMTKRYAECLSVNDIASELNVSVSPVFKKIRRAKREIEEKIK